MPAPVALLALALAAQADPAVPGHEGREWRVRALARELACAAGGAGATDELRADLARSAWRERAAALEALVRSRAAGAALPDELRSAVTEALEDPHPNVRALALAALDERGAPEGALIRRLARDEFPPVRLELARFLGAAAPEYDCLRLAELALDPDERVAAAARQALFGLQSEEARRWRCSLLVPLASGAGAGALVELVRGLALVPFDPVLLGCAREFLAGPSRAARGRRALFEALAFARAEGGDPAALIEGWIGSGWDARRARLLAQAAHAGDSALAGAALSALEALELLEAGAERDASPWPGLRADYGDLAGDPGMRELVRAGLVELWRETLGPERALVELARVPPDHALLPGLMLELGPLLADWDEDLAGAWCSPGAPVELRAALVRALAASFSAAGGPGAARLLARLLADPESTLRARAFEALCAAPSLSPEVDAALHAAWRELAPDERAARLAWFSRERAAPAFRAEWVALGEAGGAARRSACELLAPFEGDAEAHAALMRWLEEDLARLAHPVPREEELRVQGELRALARVGAQAAVLARALEAALGRSNEIGKVAASALARSASGRDELERLLRAGRLAAEADRRTRIESAIGLAGGTTSQRELATELLAADRPGAAWDLRERMLGALADAGTPGAWALLAELALDPLLEPTERIAALGDLARSAGALAVPTLERAAGAGPDPETRRSAIEELGSLGGAEARAALARLFAGLPGASLSLEERPVVRAELLAALGSAGGFPPELEPEWLRAPLAAAERERGRRLSGGELPVPEFAWRGEIRLAEALAREQRARAALGRSGEWWRIDGRALLVLGEGVLRGGERPAARELLAASVIALLGERDPDPLLLGRARLRLLGLCWELEDFAAAARLGADLAWERRAGRIADALWAEFLGSFDRTRGIDPDARFASSVWQARARAALERGELEAARTAAGQARRLLGRSELARQEQEELERALGTLREQR